MSRAKEKKSYSIKYKLVVNFMLMLIPVLLLGYISQTITTKTIEKEATVSTTNTINQMVKNVESIKQSVYELYKQLRTDDEFAKQISIDYASLDNYSRYSYDKRMNRLLSKYINASFNVSNITFLMENGRLISKIIGLMWIKPEDIGKIIDTDWMQGIEAKKGQFLTGGLHLELEAMKVKYKLFDTGYAFYCGAYVKDFYTGNTCYMILDISKDAIRKIFKGVSLGAGSEIHLVNDDGRDIKFDGTTNNVYTSMSRKFDDANLLEKLLAYEGDEGYIFSQYKGQEYLVVLERIPNANSMMIGLIPKQQLGLASRQIAIIMYVLILVTSLIIIILGVFVFPNQIYHKMKFIIDKMKAVAEGHIETKEDLPGNDEFSIIDSYFNEMIMQLNTLIKENYIKEIEKKQAKLDALQFQINPHFLYNTLASINAMAAVRGHNEITEMTEKLGDMFRYNMSSGNDKVPLRDEIIHINNYIDIENIRFGNKISVFIDIEEGLENNLVSRFILQPIVENAIKHGFKDLKREGFIEVVAYHEGNHLVIKILDDGVGMKPEKVMAINESFRVKEGSNRSYRSKIGLRNVNARIQLTFGGNYGLQIYSEDQIGTEAVFTLPYVSEKEGEDYV